MIALSILDIRSLRYCSTYNKLPTRVSDVRDISDVHQFSPPQFNVNISQGKNILLSQTRINIDRLPWTKTGTKPSSPKNASPTASPSPTPKSPPPPPPLTLANSLAAIKSHVPPQNSPRPLQRKRRRTKQVWRCTDYLTMDKACWGSCTSLAF